MRFSVSVGLVGLLWAAGCGGGEKSPTAATAGSGQAGDIKVTKKLEKLVIKDIKVGTGPAAKNGDLVAMQYSGTLLSGKQFDSNASPDKEPYSFVLGTRSVIKGWDEGLIGMKKGGTRKLEIPAELGYGDQAMGDIPPGSDLYFDVTLLDIVPSEDYNVFDKTDLKVGSGAVAKMGDTVTIHYIGKLVNQKEFDNTYDRKKPATFELGTGASTGFDAAVVGMRVGGKRSVRIPPAIGYGIMGKPPKIPANSILLFEVELLSVQPKKK